MITSVDTHSAEIHWDPPRGQFSKYTLMFEKAPNESAAKDFMNRTAAIRSSQAMNTTLQGMVYQQ